MTEGWKNVDPHEVQKRAKQQREDATTSGNVGAFPVPLGGVLKPALPNKAETKKKKG